MKIRTKGISVILAALFIALAALLASAPETSSSASGADEAIARLTTEEAGRGTVGKTDFALIYASDSAVSVDQTKANVLRTLLNLSISPKPDIAVPAEGQYEILLGQTDRQASADLLAELVAACKNADDLAWAYAYRDGKLLYLANSNIAFDLGWSEFTSVLEIDENGDLSIPSDLHAVRIKTMAEYRAELEADAEAQRQERIDALIATNSKFTQDQFGGAPQEMPSGMYALPETYPTPNQHPRMFVANADLSKLYDTLMNDPQMEAAKDKIFEYATSADYTGIFPDKIGSSGEVYRFNSTILAQMEARAFLYLLTGDEIYGYEAIIGAKNAMLSLKYTTDLHMDVYHGASQVMVNVAKVYDWCYDLLTDDDKNQLIAGVSNVLGPQMESGMRFPPSGMNAVSGHGTGPQFIRDWMTVSIVFYDEMPSWWDFVGGRYYEKYVPVIDIASENGWASQGTVTYGDSKYFTRSWAAWLVTTNTGEFPYTEDFHDCAYYYFSHIQPNGNYFQTGDGTRAPDGCAISDSCAYMFIAAALFDDPTIAAMAKYYSNDYTRFSYSFTTEMTAPDMLIFYTLGPEVNEEPMENIDLIQYFDSPAGTMTARNSWSEDGIAVLMRVGEMTMANHDLYDHGTFQIYYKGLLAGTSGSYKKYGGYVHKYYLQATVAHNGLLVFDPSLADAEPSYGKNQDGSENRNVITNAARYFYSGSQLSRSSPADIEEWTNGSYEMGEVLGAEWGYNTDGSAGFAYIGGDITASYPKAAASYVGRKMLTVFTGDPDYPMLFFTYDQITANGEDFIKYFLLHTLKEPEIDETDMSATVTTDTGGKLVLRSLSGADTITKIGGEGKAFWINGKNCLDEYTTTDDHDKIWGRIELSATGSLSDTLFSAMYVTDTAVDKKLDFKTQANDAVEYTQVLDVVAAFTKTEADARYEEFSFRTEGNGLYEYYVSGLEAGTWRIKVDGVAVATVVSADDGKFVSFIAPTGNVTVTPGADVIGGNGGRIKYNTGGGVFDGEYPIIYNSDEATPLPTNISKTDSFFLGWYSTPTFEEETMITEIPVGMTGTFSVYAKWLNNIANVDYNTRNVDVTSGKPALNGVTYNLNNSEGASFKTKKNGDGVGYLEWIEGAGTPFLTSTSSSNNYATMSTDDECASFTVTLSKNGSATVPATQFRIYTKNHVNGTTGDDTISRQYIFTTNENGEVRLGDSNAGPIAAILGETPTTLRIVIDFKNEEIRAYDAYGSVTASVSVKPKAVSGASTMSEWRKLLDSILFYWVTQTSATDCSMRIYNIKIDEGDRFKDLEPVDGMIVYDLGGGGILTGDAPIWYSKQEATKLPEPIAAGSNTFGGWYSSPTFNADSKITEVPANATGIYRVYAKWTISILDEDYSDVNMNVNQGDGQSKNVTYRTNSGTGTSFITMTDTDGTKYLEWHEGTASTNPFLLMTGGAIASISDTSVSYEFTFSKNGADPLPSFYLRTLAQYNLAGEKLQSSNSLPLFKVTSDGIYLSADTSGSKSENDIKISDITDGKMTVRIVLNFASCQIKAYTEDGNILIRSFDVPASSGAATGVDFQKTFTTYVLYMMTTSPASVTDASMRVYSFRITSGNVFETEGSLDGKISYITDGAALPEDAPKEYLPDKATTLPTDLTKENSVFCGWYTTPDYKDGTKVTEILPGTTGLVTLYARWLTTVISEDYSSTEVNVGESTTSQIQGINYNAGSSNEPKPGSSFGMMSDGSNKYLAVTANEKNSVIAVMSSTYNLPLFSETAISYQLDLKKLADHDLANYSGLITTSGANYGRLYIYEMNASGELSLVGSDKVFATVTETFTTVRITVDFAKSTATAYGADGTPIDTVMLEVPAAKDGYTQPADLSEWQKVATNYIFYANITKSTSDENAVGIGIDNIKIIDGRAFGDATVEIAPEEGVEYVTNGGSMPAGTSTDFAEGAATPLAVPERSGYVFGGWYTSETFDEGDRVTEAPLGTTGIYTVYAKWLKVIAHEDYSVTELDITESTGNKNGFNYNGGSSNDPKPGASFKTLADGESRYLVWIKGEKDPIIYASNGAIAKSDELAFSYEVTFRRNGDAPLIGSTARTMAQFDANGNKLSTSAKIYIFNTKNDGSVYLSNGTESSLGTVPEDGSDFTVRVVIDFAELKIKGYLTDGSVVTADIEIPAETGVTTGADYAALMTTYVFCWQATSASDAAGSVIVERISVTEGNIFE